MPVRRGQDHRETGGLTRRGLSLPDVKDTGAHMVCAGIFDDEDGLSFRSQVFIDAKPDYYSFAEDTENLTGEELFALVQGTAQE